VKIFFDNRALFLLATLEHGEYFRQFDADFGIVPYPKYDEAQVNYRSTSDQWGLSCVIPKTATNLTSWFAKRESVLKAQYQKLYDYAESQK
jgi:hypothetical protein